MSGLLLFVGLGIRVLGLDAQGRLPYMILEACMPPCLRASWALLMVAIYGDDVGHYIRGVLSLSEVLVLYTDALPLLVVVMMETFRRVVTCRRLLPIGSKVRRAWVHLIL